jgi:hypothetical protein
VCDTKGNKSFPVYTSGITPLLCHMLLVSPCTNYFPHILQSEKKFDGCDCSGKRLDPCILVTDSGLCVVNL